jgi:hypothetical protein
MVFAGCWMLDAGHEKGLPKKAFFYFSERL